MATAALTPHVSVEEYLSTMYHPDVDYVDGHIEERHLGEFDHATLQGALLYHFHVHRREWRIRVVPEVRVQATASRFRIPDVTVISLDNPKEQIVRTAPILCLEVLSPEDRLPRMLARIGDYFKMGVPEVWIFDPAARKAYICKPEGLVEEFKSGTLKLTGTQIELELGEIFASLDED